MKFGWLDTQFEEMVALVETWGNINSYSKNSAGLARMADVIDQAYSRLEPDEKQILTFPNGKGLLYKKRAHAPFQVYLGGHLDTVFAPESPFQKVTYLEDRKLQGPGIFDMKGGLVILLKALEALEREPFSSKIGWVVCLNPDEEIGSPHSTPLIRSSAKGCNLALLFEPTLEDGAFVSSRPASFSFVASTKGKQAHAGRDPQKGINAIYPLASFISTLAKWHQPDKGQIVNVGTISGGKAPNIVPDMAECAFIARAFKPDKALELEDNIKKAAHQFGVKLHCISKRPPKSMDPKTDQIFELLKICGKELGMAVKWKETAGVSDGNTLSDAGIPVIDTMGAAGGKAHTEDEFIQLESLMEKAKLTVLLLEKAAQRYYKDNLDEPPRS